MSVSYEDRRESRKKLFWVDYLHLAELPYVYLYEQYTH